MTEEPISPHPSHPNQPSQPKVAPPAPDTAERLDYLINLLEQLLNARDASPLNDNIAQALQLLTRIATELEKPADYSGLSKQIDAKFATLGHQLNEQAQQIEKQNEHLDAQKQEMKAQTQILKQLQKWLTVPARSDPTKTAAAKD